MVVCSESVSSLRGLSCPDYFREVPITDGSPPLDALPAVLQRFTGRIVGGAGGRLGYAERIPCRHRVTSIGARPTSFLRCSFVNKACLRTLSAAPPSPNGTSAGTGRPASSSRFRSPKRVAQ